MDEGDPHAVLRLSGARRLIAPGTLGEEELRFLRRRYDDSVPLPPGAAEYLDVDNPRLLTLRRAYAGLDTPAVEHSRWQWENVARYLDLRHFRGDSLIQWPYRELPRPTQLKLFLLLSHVQERDPDGLLERLGEDGLFGCFTYRFAGRPLVSRDLLDAVGELAFLDRTLSISSRPGFRIIDVGAGYGRLAHRATTAFPGIGDYCCVDAVAESTFLSEYYLDFRGCSPPARVLPLPELSALAPDQFDLAINVHSFSECTLAAVTWWVQRLRALRVPRLFIVPNEADGFLSTEADGSTRHDLMPVLADAGYALRAREPVIDDLAVREAVRLHDHFHLFELVGGGGADGP